MDDAPDIIVPTCVLLAVAVAVASAVGGLPLHAAAVAVNPAVNIAIVVAFEAFDVAVVDVPAYIVDCVDVVVGLFTLVPLLLAPLCCNNKSCRQVKSRSPATNVLISGSSGFVRNFARRMPGMKRIKMGNSKI